MDLQQDQSEFKGISGRQETGGARHVTRVFLLLAGVLVAGAVVRALLVPAGYGEKGGYRLENLREIASQTPVLQARSACADCHDEIVATHAKDIHVHVECEVCHGPGDRHVRYHLGEGSEGDDSAAFLPKEYTREGCLYCHRELAARPADFPQVDAAAHYEFLSVLDPATPCVECHSPHEPLFLLTRVSEARIHPLIRECRDCHDGTPAGDHREAKNHPTIFLCRDCHEEVTADFASREHSFLRCTACHLFHRDSESAGRIFKNGNRRFCLLCHEAKPFKDPQRQPQIVWEEHVAEMAEAFEKDGEALARDSRACLSCHYEMIHDPAMPARQGANP
jgi:hypothetical protein